MKKLLASLSLLLMVSIITGCARDTTETDLFKIVEYQEQQRGK